MILAKKYLVPPKKEVSFAMAKLTSFLITN